MDLNLWSLCAIDTSYDLKLSMSGMSEVFYSLMLKDRHLGLLHLPVYKEAIAPISVLPQQAPLASQSLASAWPIAWASPYGFRTHWFFSEWAMGIFSERFAMNYKELLWMVLSKHALFGPSLPSRGQKFFRQRTYTKPVHQACPRHLILSWSSMPDLLMSHA